MSKKYEYIWKVNDMIAGRAYRRGKAGRAVNRHVQYLAGLELATLRSKKK